MILVFGSINMDLVARVDAIARPGETVLSRRADSFFGGKGANQAVAAARIAQGGPVPVAMAGALGDDPFGHACLANLRENAVETEHVVTLGEPTGCAFITVDAAGENAITVASGANAALQADIVSDELLSRAAVLVLQMEVPLDENLSLAQRARQAGVQVVWNLAPAPSGIDRSRAAAILAAADMIVVNEHEALATAALVGDTAPSGYEDAAALLAKGHDLVCIATAGPNGALAVRPDGTCLRAPAPVIAPIDTTGAGDTFVGALAVGLAEKTDLETAMARACVAASRACLKLGAQAGMPTREELEQALADQAAQP